MFTLERLLSNPLVQKLGWTLLHLVWQAGAVALLLAIVLKVLRKSTANLRYIIACLALVMVVLAPMITFSLVSVPDPAPAVESISIPLRLSAVPQEFYTIDTPIGRAAEYLEMSAPTSWTQRAKDWYTSALPYIVLGWLIGVAVLAVWHLGGWAQLQRLKRRMVEEVDRSLRSKLRDLTEKLRVRRAVTLMQSALVQIPTVVGWLRPVILLPATALTGLTAEQLEALLAHELAHIKRFDYLVNVLQTVVEILGFYHPAVWWISHKIRVERENCCDDLAVGICGDTRRYVKALAQMERIRSGDVELAIAASGANLSRRISRLLGKEAGRKRRTGWAPAAIAAVLIIALAIPASLALSGGEAKDPAAADLGNLVADSTTDAMLPPAPATPVLAETTGERQILIKCTLYAVPTDSEFLGDLRTEQSVVRLGKDVVDLLSSGLIGVKGVKVLANPQILILDGTEAKVVVAKMMPYIVGYEPEPIVKSVSDGIEVNIKGHIVGDNALRLNVDFAWSRASFEQQKDEAGREIQIPKVTRHGRTTAVTVGDGETVLVGGLKDEQETEETVILQITPHIIRKAEEQSIRTEVDVTVESPPEPQPTKPVEDLVAAIRGALTCAEQLTDVGRQPVDLGKIHEIVSAQGFTIDAASLSGDEYRLLISKTIDGDGKKRRLVCHLKKQDDRWLIDEIDLKPYQRVEKAPAPVPPAVRQVGKIVRTPPVPPAEVGTLPVRAKSPALSTGDRTIIQIDCLVVEVFTDLKMDSETAATVKHLLGDKLSLPSPETATASDLLRQVADVTAASKDTAIRRERVTENEFKALVDVLVSKGYVKILMNPTLEVLDGKTAKITSTQDSLEDSLEITPRVLADGGISLQVEAVLASKSAPESEEQIPITQRKFSSVGTRVRPGQSLIIGGIKKTEKRSETHGSSRVTDERPTEVLFILIPTIVGSADQAEQLQEVRLRTRQHAAAVPRADETNQALQNLLDALEYADELKPPDEALLRALDYMHQEDGEHAKYARLAAVFAERGDFEQAVKHQKRAIELAEAAKHYGIGITFETADSGIRVVQIIDGGPAEGSGLNPGDVISAVNGQSIQGLSQYAAAAKIVGPKGTPVKLTVKSPDQDRTRDITLQREHPIDDWPGMIEYRQRLAAYQAGRTFSEYHRMAEQANADRRKVRRVFELKRNSPQRVADVLGELLGNRAKDTQDETPAGILFSVSPESNRLVVVGSEADVKAAATLIAQLEGLGHARVQESAEDSIVEIFALKYADCDRVAATLEPLLTGTTNQITIVPDARTNRLIIQAYEQDLKRIRDLIREIDVPTEETTPKATATCLELKYVDSDQATAALMDLLTDVPGLKILHAGRSNGSKRLIIQAPEAELKRIEARVAEIDAVFSITTYNVRATKEDSATLAQKVRILEEQRKALADKLQSHRQKILELAQEYGTTDLTKHQDVKLQRVASLMDTLTQTEARRIQLESELKLLEQTGEQPAAPQELLKMRQDYINNDPTIKALAEKLAETEIELLMARQTLPDENPEIKKKTKLLQALQRRLHELKREVGFSFDELMAKENAKATQQKRARLQAELQQLEVHERRLRYLLDQEDAKTRDLGRQQLELQDLQRQMELDQQLYDSIGQRIMELRGTIVPQGATRLLDEQGADAKPGQEGSVPILGDIPVLGRLFSHRGTSEPGSASQRDESGPVPDTPPAPVAPGRRTLEAMEVEPAPEAPPAVTPPAPKAQED